MLKKIVAYTLFIIIIVFSIAAPLLAPYSPTAIDMSLKLQSPSAEHWLGTDALGRDLFSRIIYGGRRSLLLAFIATVVAMSVGMLFGFISGYYGGKVDYIITIFTNIFFGIPGICITIAIVGIVGPGITSLILAVVINGWAGFSRIVRGEVMRIKSESYIEAARNMGVNDAKIFVKHIVPNLSDSLVVLFFSKIGSVLLFVAALSYLGLGLKPPTPDWAIMIADSRPYFRTYPILVLAPGVCITLFVWSVLSIGEIVRNKLDVKGDNYVEM